MTNNKYLNYIFEKKPRVSIASKQAILLKINYKYEKPIEGLNGIGFVQHGFHCWLCKPNETLAVGRRFIFL
jgi:hypothetical protein